MRYVAEARIEFHAQRHVNTSMTRVGQESAVMAMQTSMLQDAEAGRSLELDALVGAVVEIGGRVGVPTPHTNALFGLARLSARVRGLY